MPLINRATLPQEFFDFTSAMLLTQPEPKYLHAKLIKAALGASFQGPSMLGFLPGRSFGDRGAPYVSDSDAEAARLSLSDDLYDASIQVIAELGSAPGQTVRMNRPSYANTTYTEASREVPSGSTVSVTPITVTSEQVPITLKRFAGPFDQANVRVAPYGIDRFDSSVMLHKPAQIVALNLKRDFDRTLDAWGVQLFDNAATTVRPNGMVNDNTSVIAGSFPFSFRLIQSTETQLDTLNIPTFANGKRVLVLHPRQCEQLAQDAQFNRLSVFESDFNPLWKGAYWRSCGNFDIFKSTTLTQVTNANAVQIHYAQAFGPGGVGCGVGEMPRTAYNTQDNYGETALVIWLWYAGFATLDHRFIARITTD